jgi:hypothetical protein
LSNQAIKSKTGIDLGEALEKKSIEEILDEDIIKQIKELKSKFEQIVKLLISKDCDDKLIIMIDDLDRIKPVRALEFLEAIKNFLDVESCVFLIAVDYSVIQTGMVEKLGRTAQELQGKSYFDKIIQVPFSMPSSSYQINKYIMFLLGWDFDKGNYFQINESRDKFFLKISNKEIKEIDVFFFTNITSLTVGKNPRSIKRAVNYANLLRMIVQSNRKGTGNRWTLEDAKFLYPLACMQLAWPELFTHFVNEPDPNTFALMQDFDYLQGLKGMNRLFKRVHNPEETMSNITGFIDEFLYLIDHNHDGNIDSDEFNPIWDMMVDANLTTSKKSLKKTYWENLENLARKHASVEQSKLITEVINLFQDSNSLWNNSRKFNLLMAGQRFYNITWNRRQIGSFVSIGKEPFTMYLKAEWTDFTLKLNEDFRRFISDCQSIGHLGIGAIKVDLFEIVTSNESMKIINDLFNALELE